MGEEQANKVAEADEAKRTYLKSLFSLVLLINSRSAVVLAMFLALLFEPFFVFAVRSVNWTVVMDAHQVFKAVERLFDSHLKIAEFMSHAWLLNLWYRHSCVTSLRQVILLPVLSGIQTAFFNLFFNVWQMCQTTRYCRPRVGSLKEYFWFVNCLI